MRIEIPVSITAILSILILMAVGPSDRIPISAWQAITVTATIYKYYKAIVID
jgi:hypothetical protein